MQNYLSLLINSNATSIYSSAYQESLIHFQTLQQWLITGLHWHYLLAASVIVLATARHQRAKQIFAIGALSTFLALSALDLILGIANQRLSISYTIENLVANAIGSLAFSLTFVAIMAAGATCYKHLAPSKFLRTGITALATILLGICLSATIFYSVEFFYRPLPVKLDVVLDYPTSGIIGTAEKSHNSDESDNSLQLFPKSIDSSSIQWLGKSEAFSAHWKMLPSKNAYDASIEFFADCYRGAINATSGNQGNQIEISDVKNLRVSTDLGSSEFGTLTRSKMTGTLQTNFGDVTLYWLDKDDDTENVKITQFVEKKANIILENKGQEVGFYINAPLYSSDHPGIVPSGRKLAVTINDKIYNIQAEASQSLDQPLDTRNCKSISIKDALREDTVTTSNPSTYLNILVRIFPKRTPSYVYGINDSELAIRGGNGWVSISHPGDQTSHSYHQKGIELISFKGNIAHLDVDDISISPKPIDHYDGFGSFTLSFENKSKIRFRGEALAFRKNSHRQNPTKWERFNQGSGLLPASTIIAFLVAAFGFMATIIRKNERINWTLLK